MSKMNGLSASKVTCLHYAQTEQHDLKGGGWVILNVQYKISTTSTQNHFSQIWCQDEYCNLTDTTNKTHPSNMPIGRPLNKWLTSI